MRRALALVLLLPLAAGCAGSAFLPLAVPEAPLPGLAFAAPVAMPGLQGRGAEAGYEPSVAVDGQGVVYVTAPRGFKPGASSEGVSSGLWVSGDGGASFRAVPLREGASFSNVPAGFEGHVDAREGTAYFVDLSLASITVSRSLDGGRSWELRTPAAALVPGGDREWVAAGPGEAVYVVWNQIPSGFWIMGSEDGGRTFPVQTLLPGSSFAGGAGGGGGWSFAGVPAVAPDGTLYVARAEAEGVAVYASRDGARSFQRSLAWPAQGSVGWLFSTATVDAAGTLYVSSVEELANGTRVRYAFSKDGGATFGEPREASAAPGVHAMQWSAAGPPGTLALAFYENPAATGVPDQADGAWHVRVVLIEGADTSAPRVREGRPTERVVHEGPICTGGLTACEGEGRDKQRALGDYLGVDVGPDGSAHVVWIESADAASPVLYARAH